MARKYVTKNGKQTDVLHSTEYFNASYKERGRMLSDVAKKDSDAAAKDKLLARGYLQARKEQAQAYKFKKNK